ncbi:uncharacterized protein LOC111068322 [Drosophila obscura]|uniref:uncharacterized protein LOC111068322 n=1 Tax=Drosophila obscura TaxID=7282 RepID=UPI001BB1C6E3|nr:uncharacterized protein LOC111068322 [Drosophila obscura]
MPVKAALAGTMKAEKLLQVLILVVLDLSWTASGERRRQVRHRHARVRASKIMRSHQHIAETWPACLAVDDGLGPLMKSAIEGQLSKKLLQKCGYEEELPQLEVWREKMSKKLENDSVMDVISWLYDEVEILAPVEELPSEHSPPSHDQTNSKDHHPSQDHPPSHEHEILPQYKDEMEVDSEGPPSPEQCHDYRSFVQVVNDEPGVDDTDWTKRKKY